MAQRTLTIRLKGNRYRVFDPEGERVVYVDELHLNQRPIEADELHADVPASSFHTMKAGVGDDEIQVGKVSV